MDLADFSIPGLSERERDVCGVKDNLLDSEDPHKLSRGGPLKIKEWGGKVLPSPPSTRGKVVAQEDGRNPSGSELRKLVEVNLRGTYINQSSKGDPLSLKVLSESFAEGRTAIDLSGVETRDKVSTGVGPPLGAEARVLKKSAGTVEHLSDSSFGDAVSRRIVRS